IYTADKLDMPRIYVEKDYWVTFVLYTLFNSDRLENSLVFKGGTSLLKCYNCIQRFSEDIDLVLLHNQENNNQLKSKLKHVTDTVSEVLEEIYVEGVTNKKGMIRKTAHSYPHLFKDEYGQVRESIILEATWLGYFEPYTQCDISSFIGDVLLKNNQEDLAKKYGLLPFQVNVLEPARTLCEKIMSLVRFSYGDDYIKDLNLKIRHIYDIHQLLLIPNILVFFQSNSFDEMLIKVARDDFLSFKNNNEWLNNHPIDSFMFRDIDFTWSKLKTTYHTLFKKLVFGELPNNEAILHTLDNVYKRLKRIHWDLS
ncbi:nucleotidyl transferase AbiEii/AbiGii toxin family protein, partial [Ursidibacter maritimus]|uniref:nucleotidyl transferase AbiEii/AbiGii toxin family protein n=1 Tax=Ursidibacter maritimus TaxID=1331689 RepID=UPI001C44C179